MWRSALRGAMVYAAPPVCLALVVVACAQGEADGSDPGVVATSDDAGTGDGRAPSSSSSSGGTGSKEGGGGGGGGGEQCTGKVVINELMPDDVGAEFVELYNPNDCEVSLGNWKLLYRAKNGNTGTPLHAFSSGATIAAKSFFLLGNAKFDGNKDADLTGGMGNDGGQLGLVDDTDTLVDAVGYASGTTGEYTENKAAPLPPAGDSVGRKSDGVDTDDNSADFASFTTPSPGAEN